MGERTYCREVNDLDCIEWCAYYDVRSGICCACALAKDHETKHQCCCGSQWGTGSAPLTKPECAEALMASRTQDIISPSESASTASESCDWDYEPEYGDPEDVRKALLHMQEVSPSWKAFMNGVRTKAKLKEGEP